MFVVSNRLITYSRPELIRKFCMKAVKSKVKFSSNAKKSYGQPTFETHPHLLNCDEVTPLITKGEYQERRRKLAEKVVCYAKKNRGNKNHLIVIPAASRQYMSDKIPYVFRQNTEFLYITGCQEPDCCIVITTGASADDHCATLFTRDRDDHAELWDGPRTHPEDAPAFFGVDQSLPISELEGFMQSYKKTFRDSSLWYDFMTPVQDNVHKMIFELMNATGNKCWENPKPLLHELRLYKSTAEIALMQKSCDITSQAFIEAMACSRPGISENQIFGKIDYECRMRGAEYLAYPPVVAGANRSTIIHYINNNQILNHNETVLVDAGCEYHGYSSDVTRTWPINGKFTQQQREIYEVVYCVQEELIKYCNNMPSLDELFESMCCLLGKRLQEIGLIGVQPSNNYLMKAAYQLCPHHVSHYLGMDIHDTPTVRRNIKLEPGMIITVEPGIYISERSKLPKEYHGIGVRIEDDILITVNGPVVLSRRCPKSIDEIEKIVSEGQAQP